MKYDRLERRTARTLAAGSYVGLSAACVYLHHDAPDDRWFRTAAFSFAQITGTLGLRRKRELSVFISITAADDKTQIGPRHWLLGKSAAMDVPN